MLTPRLTSIQHGPVSLAKKVEPHIPYLNDLQKKRTCIRCGETTDTCIHLMHGDADWIPAHKTCWWLFEQTLKAWNYHEFINTGNFLVYGIIQKTNEFMNCNLGDIAPLLHTDPILALADVSGTVKAVQEFVNMRVAEFIKPEKLNNSLKDKGTKNWNTSEVIDMSDLFRGCTILNTMDVTGCDVSKTNNNPVQCDITDTVECEESEEDDIEEV